MSNPTVVVSKKAVQDLKHGHPWVFDNEIIDVQHAQGGDTVKITSENGWSLGIGFFSDSSSITIRRIDHREIFIDHDFLQSRILSAQQLRQDLIPHSTTYRMFHGEADGLPGLYIDKYEQSIVIQSICQGSDKLIDKIASIMDDNFHPQQIIIRNDHYLRKSEGLANTIHVAKGTNEGLCTLPEGSINITCNSMAGQSTGMYLDQQRNRAIISHLAHGKGLDLFCYNGGFALQMASGCQHVTAVDNEQSVLTLGQLNAQSNHIGNVEWLEQDAFEFLDQLRSSGDNYDTIVADPPENITQEKFDELLSLLLKVAQHGAYIFLFRRINPLQYKPFAKNIETICADSGRRIQIIAALNPNFDHPTLITLPEMGTFSGILMRTV